MGCRAEVVVLYDWEAGEHLGVRLHGCLPKIGACCISGKKWIFQADIINYDSNFTKGDGQNLNHQKENDWRGASRVAANVSQVAMLEISNLGSIDNICATTFYFKHFSLC